MAAPRDTSGFDRLLRDAGQAMHTAQQNAFLWADHIRQGAERRLGVDATDERALDDPAYDRALKLCSRLAGLAEETAGLVVEYQATVKMNEETP